MTDHKGDQANRDPVTGTPGAHPVGTGVGAAGAAATGAAIGAVIGGPVGALAGGTIGAVAGGLAGKGAAEKVNPTIEDAYWRDSYKSRPYVKRDTAYEAYQPAYRYGWESRAKFADRKYEEAEGDLERGWASAKGNSQMGWADAKDPVRDAWYRVDDTPGSH